MSNVHWKLHPQKFSLGRRVFKHQTHDRYLFVRPLAFKCTTWKFKVTVGDEEGRLFQGSFRGYNKIDPEDPRAWEWRWSPGARVTNELIKLTSDLDCDIDLDLDFYDRTDLFYFLRHLDQRIRLGEEDKNVYRYKSKKNKE